MKYIEQGNIYFLSNNIQYGAFYTKSFYIVIYPLMMWLIASLLKLQSCPVQLQVTVLTKTLRTSTKSLEIKFDVSLQIYDYFYTALTTILLLCNGNFQVQTTLKTVSVHASVY